MTLKAFYIRYSTWAAIFFALSMMVFLFVRNYTNMWVLYIGNILFCAVVLMGVIKANHRYHDSASVRSLFMIGVKVTVYGVIIAIVLCLLLLLVNSMFSGLSAADSPAQSGRGDTQTELLFALLSHTIGGNAFLGILASVLGSSVVRRNQKEEAGKTVY